MSDNISNVLKIAGNLILAYKRMSNGMYKFYSPEEKDRWFTIHPKSKIQWFYSDSYKKQNMKELANGNGDISVLEAGFPQHSKVIGIFKNTVKKVSSEGANVFAKELLLTRASSEKYSEKAFGNEDNYNDYLKDSLLKKIKKDHYKNPDDFDTIKDNVKGASADHIASMIKEVKATLEPKDKVTNEKPKTAFHPIFKKNENNFKFHKDQKYKDQYGHLRSTMTKYDGLSSEDQDSIFKSMLHEKKHNIGQKGWGRSKEQIKQAFLKHINPKNFSSPEAYKKAIERLKKIPADLISGLIHEITEEDEV